ncbi:MAG: (Na+)-NQR maturation NqrM [Acidobacteria bacterium]|nr:(Na+)-NQR maturation NqrM [Acidobacteriota bacterium]MDA1237281.1 (Na+)-NQR maturation NqrM [Acidobacteriota bacterium]
MLGLVGITILAIGILMAAMAVGVIFNRKSLRGSCGGADVVDCDGESLACGSCPNKADNQARKAKQNELLQHLSGR